VGAISLDVRALQPGELVSVGLVREQDGKAHGRFVEAAVVVKQFGPHLSARIAGPARSGAIRGVERACR
jgi:hypothetical protein